MKWSQVTKRVVSLGLIFGSLGFYANSRWQLNASYAVVAGPAIVINAPIDGVLSQEVARFSVSLPGAQVASIQPTPMNDPELRAAAAELETVRADVKSLQDVIAFAEDMRSKTLSRQAQLTSRRAEHLKHLLDQAESELNIKTAQKEAADVVLARSIKLCSEGLMGAQDCDNARSQVQIGDREVTSAKSQLSIARFLLEAGRSGADIAENLGGEVTYARQQRDDLTMRLASWHQQLETQTGRANALELRVHPPVSVVSVPSRTRIWSVFRQSGVQVVKGEPLLQVVDCAQLFVFAGVTEQKYEKLRIGTSARVTIDGHTLMGRVAQLLGPYGTFSQDRSMQPQPPVILNGTDATSAGVAVEVNELQSIVGPQCEVGTRATVTFVQ